MKLDRVERQSEVYMVYIIGRAEARSWEELMLTLLCEAFEVNAYGRLWA